MKTISQYTNNETIAIWIEGLLEENDKTRIKDLTARELEREIKEVKGTIKNERLWSLADDDGLHLENLTILEEYLKVLNQILTELREEKKS